MTSMTHDLTDMHVRQSAQWPARPRASRPRIPRELLGACGAMHTLRKLVWAFAPYDMPLLIVGEAGTGTRRIAEFVHRWSAHRDGAFVAADAAALSEERLVLDLCGCEPGGPVGWPTGMKEVGQGGTLLVEQVERLPTWALRRLHLSPANVRVLATLTGGADWHQHEDPGRQILLDRLSGGFPLLVPPLRERGRDIVLLSQHCLAEANRELGKEVRGFTTAALAAMQAYPWPGNLQELADCVRSAVLAASHSIGLRHLAFLPPQWRRPQPAPHRSNGGADDA